MSPVKDRRDLVLLVQQNVNAPIIQQGWAGLNRPMELPLATVSAYLRVEYFRRKLPFFGWVHLAELTQRMTP